MLQQTLLDTEAEAKRTGLTLFKGNKLAPLSIEVGPVTITQDEDDHQKAWVSIGDEAKQLSNDELHQLYACLDMFMTAMNYQKQGWQRPFVKD